MASKPRITGSNPVLATKNKLNMLNWFKKKFGSKKEYTEPRILNDYEFNKLKKDNQDRLDKILDKISDKGLKSLTKEELNFLNKKINI